MANSINNPSKAQSNNSNNYLKGSAIAAFASQVDKDNLAKEKNFKRNTFDNTFNFGKDYFGNSYYEDPSYSHLPENIYYNK